MSLLFCWHLVTTLLSAYCCPSTMSLLSGCCLTAMFRLSYGHVTAIFQLRCCGCTAMLQCFCGYFAPPVVLLLSARRRQGQKAWRWSDRLLPAHDPPWRAACGSPCSAAPSDGALWGGLRMAQPKRMRASLLGTGPVRGAALGMLCTRHHGTCTPGAPGRPRHLHRCWAGTGNGPGTRAPSNSAPLGAGGRSHTTTTHSLWPGSSPAVLYSG